MRSVLAFAALAISGTVDFVAGSACKPRSSNTIPTLASSTAEPTSSATPSDVALPKVRNLAVNGNMGEVDPTDPLAVPGWDVVGEAKIVGGQGREVPGSTERGAAAMSASNTGDGKRAMGISVSISQTLSALDTTTPYTIRFYYLVITSPQAINLCQLTAFLGGAVFYENWVFSSGMAVSWNEVLKSVSPAQVNAPLRIEMNCLIGGGATVLVDSVFISNLVTPQTIDDFSIDFGNSGTGANPPLDPPAVGPQTTTDAVPTTTQSEDQQTSTPDTNLDTTTGFETGTQTHSAPVVATTSTDVDPPFCSKSLNGGCWWKRPDSGEDMVNCASRGSWPGPSGQGRLVPQPKGYPKPLSQLWCLGWCSLSPGCKSVAHDPDNNTCRFSEHEVQDADFIHGPDPNLDTEGVFYWHDLSCFNCPCEDEPVTTTTSLPEPEETTQTHQPTSKPSSEVKLPAASTCPLSLNDGCRWNSLSQGGSNPRCAYRGRWPGSDGAGYAVEKPHDYPMALSQMWCVSWCSLSPGCRSAAWMPSDRSCRFSSHAVHDDDFVMAQDPNKDSVAEGIYYWHDLSCMDCPCRDESTSQPSTETIVASTREPTSEPTDEVTIAPTSQPPTTFVRSITSKPVFPSVSHITLSQVVTPTPGPAEQPCEWSNGQGICYRPFEKEQGPCGGTLIRADPQQYTKLPLNWTPAVTEPVHCAILCHTNPDCHAWGFEWSSNMNCVLARGQREVTDLQVVSSAPQYHWYSHTCWECRDCVSAWDWTWNT
ncbi:Ff.00g005150.m01.CDS01 [Fusarium sp. VM40]|nr:Ff.00g005150.m01.CDS01 [Fusarium sp. VM40]